MIDQKQIDAKEVASIFKLFESYFLDLKRSAVSPAKLSESVSAFANTAGGELFIGIGEGGENHSDRFWDGFKSMEDANGLFALLSDMVPIGMRYHATWLSSNAQPGFVLHLIIPKTKDIVKASNGHPYIRSNAQNLRVIGEDALTRLRLDKGITTFEDEVLNTPLSTITNSMTTIKFMLSVIPTAEPDDWMSKQYLTSEKCPTVAGILLFADEPQAALPKRSAIKIYRYGTSKAEGKREQLIDDPITIEGCLYDQIMSAVRQTKSLIEGIKTLTGKGLEPVSYPDETLHEIITNAVLHRDYSILADVQVRIYDNRIEVESPGRLSGHITTKNILKEQSARNPKIVRLINKFPNPPNKDVGEGLNTAFEAMKKMRLKEPEIIEEEHSLVVHIRHTPLASPHEAVMAYLENHTEITNLIARNITGIESENSMKNVFVALKEKGLIEPVPGKERGGGAAWQNTKNAGK